MCIEQTLITYQVPGTRHVPGVLFIPVRTAVAVRGGKGKRKGLRMEGRAQRREPRGIIGNWNTGAAGVHVRDIQISTKQTRRDRIHCLLLLLLYDNTSSSCNRRGANNKNNPLFRTRSCTRYNSYCVYRPHSSSSSSQRGVLCRHDYVLMSCFYALPVCLPGDPLGARMYTRMYTTGIWYGGTRDWDKEGGGTGSRKFRASWCCAWRDCEVKTDTTATTE